MSSVTRVILMFALTAGVAAQSQDRPLSDTRLTVHTLLREDIFAGFLANDMNRFEKAERNIQVLLEQRPDQRANLLAWKGSTVLYRGVLAHEGQRPAEFERYYKQALDLFAEARSINNTGDGGVPAITGGSFAVFADRLPAEYRRQAWTQAFDSYQVLWNAQGATIDKLPVHHRGEVLAGLAQSAQRIGRTDDASLYLDKMIALMQGTPYEAMAVRWKREPEAAANTSLACKACHEPGRLSARLEAVNK